MQVMLLVELVDKGYCYQRKLIEKSHNRIKHFHANILSDFQRKTKRGKLLQDDNAINNTGSKILTSTFITREDHSTLPYAPPLCRSAESEELKCYEGKKV